MLQYVLYALKGQAFFGSVLTEIFMKRTVKNVECSVKYIHDD